MSKNEHTTKFDEKKRIRILFVSHTLPFPENTGTKIRVANLLRGLLEFSDVRFVGYVDEGHPDDEMNAKGIQSLKEICPDATLLERGPYWWTPINRNSTKGAIDLIKGKGAFVFREFQCTSLTKKIREISHEFDFIWVERLWIAHHLRDLGSKIIVDVDDLESVKIRRQLAGRKLNLVNLASRYDGWKAAQAEQRAANDFLRLIVCSDTDRGFWNGKKDRIWVVPNGFSESLLERPMPAVKNKRAIFVGTLCYWPNVTAAQFFAKHVMPGLLRKVPDFEFWIVGRSPLPEVTALDNGHNVRVFADVPDVIEYVCQATVSVVPLRVGGGTRLKILESIAAGVPVISTDIGIEGIDLKPESHYLPANTAEEMGDAVIRILDDPAFAQSQVISARKAISEKYSWSGIRRSLADRFKTLHSA